MPRVSRATAYRYFPTQEALTSSSIRRRLARGRSAGHGPEDRGPRGPPRSHHRCGGEAVYAEERHVRTALGVYHDTWLRDPDSPVRKGRRMDWIDKTISPLPAEAREKPSSRPGAGDPVRTR